MSDVTFVEALPEIQTGRRPGRLAAFVQALRANPGHWGIYALGSPKTASTTAQTLRSRYGCEATVRKVDGVVTLYARWTDS